MFQERYNRIVLPFFFFLDLIIVLGLFYLLLLVLGREPLTLTFFLYTAFCWALPALYFKSYRAPRVHSFHAALRPTFFTWNVFIILYIVLSNLGLLPHHSIPEQGIFFLALAVVQHGNSLLRYNFFLNYRLQGKNIRHALLLGDISATKLDHLRRDGLHFGYQFITHVVDPAAYLDDLHTVANRQKLDIVFLKETDKSHTDAISAFCDDRGIRLKLLLSLSLDTGRRAGLDIISGFPVMDVRHEPLLYLGNRTAKRTVDIFMAVLSIIFVLSWLPIVVKLAQMFTYPGSLFFIQDRIGREGKNFRLYKFRTMRVSAETIVAKRGRAQKTKHADERVPWFGQLLRRTNLDEYPQFINILFGSMSTVGPRPHMVGEDIHLSNHVLNYRIRRFVKPGITGWAAVKGYRGGTNNLSLMQKRTEHDIWYLENWSLWLDIKIMATTVWQMITFRIPQAY